MYPQHCSVYTSNPPPHVLLFFCGTGGRAVVVVDEAVGVPVEAAQAPVLQRLSSGSG